MKLVRILLPIDQRGTTEACEQGAFALAQHFASRLEIMHLCAAPWQRLPYSTELSPFYSQELIDIGREQVVTEQSEAKAWFDRAAQAHPAATAGFLPREGLVTPTVAARARVADVTVVPSIGAKEGGFWGAVRDGALFHSGRPALVMPQGTSGEFGETVVIAWKDSVEAARAVTAAAPFLARAKRIRLLTVDEGEEDASSATAMADYLTLAGLTVEAAKIVPKSDNVGEALLLEAASQPGGLLVMGAYGHWRWREWAFGGVTQHVLRNTTVPVLMAH
jgi:nucleotide-binding universal stress UspA family protein